MKTKPNTKGVFFIRDIPTRLKDRFKRKCLKKKTTMKKAVMDFMRKYIGDE